MAIEVRLPQLGESITHAKLTQWLKKEGDFVGRGDIIAEVETDKTSVEIEAPADGVLSTILVSAGTDHVAVNELLAVLDADAEQAAFSATARATVPVMTLAPQSVHRAAPIEPALGAGMMLDETLPEALAPVPQGLDALGVLMSPLARRMARAAGLSLADIRGSGAGGRITKRDVDAALLRGLPEPNMAPPTAQPTRTTAPAPIARAEDDEQRYDVVQLSPMRRVSAERLTQSKQTIPHFYLRVECSMDAVAKVRDDLNARAAEKLSFTALTLRATALALKKVPAANATWADGAVRLYKVVDLAVAVNTPAGLIAPIVRNAGDKSVVAINRQIRELAERARQGKLKPDDYAGGTCTVSNLGMFGVTSLYPIINPPQACIIGIGAIEERTVVRDRKPAVGLMMTCTLAADHRALDGAIGAEFLAAFRDFIQDPWALLM